MFCYSKIQTIKIMSSKICQETKKTYIFKAQIRNNLIGIFTVFTPRYQLKCGSKKLELFFTSQNIPQHSLSSVSALLIYCHAKLSKIHIHTLNCSKNNFVFKCSAINLNVWPRWLLQIAGSCR